jgi:lysophospholipase L1-like esterase
MLSPRIFLPLGLGLLLAACGGPATPGDSDDQPDPSSVSDETPDEPTLDDPPSDDPPSDDPPSDDPPSDDPPVDDPPVDDPPVDDPPVDDPPVDDPPGPSGIGMLCFPDIFDPAVPGPDYDQFAPDVGSHCLGTDHQDITGIERVVFLGDSVTVGSPPTPSASFYRSILADDLAEHFSLEAPSGLWKSANPLTGKASLQDSGDFAACAKWGARTDDFLEDSSQIADCLPESERGKRTLVVFTIGGNDVASFTKDGATAPYEETLADVEEFILKLRDAVEWIKEPGRFPNGVDVVFANMFEFTDGTGDTSSCAAANLAGFDEPWEHPEWLEEFMIYANEEFMRIATDTGSDMIFLLETFCGHGFRNDDPTTRCYRGPDAERWFDLSCIHPNPTGHAKIAEMFLAVIAE